MLPKTLKSNRKLADSENYSSLICKPSTACESPNEKLKGEQSQNC